MSQRVGVGFSAAVYCWTLELCCMNHAEGHRLWQTEGS